MPKIVTKQFEVFTFDELEDQARHRAINDEINFMVEFTNYDQAGPEIKKAIDKAEQIQTPWFIGEYVFEYCKADILEALKGMSFLENGQIFSQ